MHYVNGIRRPPGSGGGGGGGKYSITRKNVCQLGQVIHCSEIYTTRRLLHHSIMDQIYSH